MKIENKIIEIISNALPFFGVLRTEDKELVLKNVKQVTFAKNTIIHKGLNECNGLLIVNNGLLRAYIVSDEGKEITLYRLQNNDVCLLTASCVIKNISFEVLVKTEKDSDILQIDTALFNKLKNNYMQVEQFTNEVLNQRFSDTVWAIEKLLFLNLHKRIAYFLLEQSELEKSNILEVTHNDIAVNIGSTREVVTKMLKYFENENILSLQKSKIEIIDIKKLQTILN